MSLGVSLSDRMCVIKKRCVSSVNLSVSRFSGLMIKLKLNHLLTNLTAEEEFSILRL